MKYNLLHKVWLICQCPIVFFCQWEGKILLKLEKRNKPLSPNFKVIRYEKITSSDSYADVSWQGKKEKRNLEVVVCEVYESQLDFIPQPNYFPEKYQAGNLSRIHEKEINQQNMLLLHTQKHFAINVERGGEKAREKYLTEKLMSKPLLYEDLVRMKDEIDKMPIPSIRFPTKDEVMLNYGELMEDHDAFISRFFPHIYEHNTKPDNQ